MSYKSSNILVGAAAVYISRADSLDSTNWNNVVFPAFVDGTPYSDTLEAATAATGWRNVGFTSAGVDFTYTPTYGEVEVDQLLDTAKMFKEKMTASVKTSLAEATLENLVVVWAQGASSRRNSTQSATMVDVTGRTVDGTKDFAGVTVPVNEEELGIEAGALGIEPVERQLAFVGGAPRTAANKKRERVYRLFRSLSVQASSHMLTRNQATLFPVEFRVLPGTVSGAEYGTIRDRVISTT